MSKQKVYIPIGLPGCGKTTYGKKLIEEDDNIVMMDRDSFRFMFRQRYLFDTKYEPIINKMESAGVQIILNNGFNVYIDNTHFRKYQRERTLSYIQEIRDIHSIDIEIIFIQFDVPLDICIERRLTNTRGYDKDHWRSVINGMYKDYEKPEEDEGQDKTLFVYN